MGECDSSPVGRDTAAAGESAAADNACAPAALARRTWCGRAGVRQCAAWAVVLGLNTALVGWILLSPAEGIARRLPVAAANMLAPVLAALWTAPALLRLLRRRRAGATSGGTAGEPSGGRGSGDGARTASAAAFTAAFLTFGVAQFVWYYYELLRREPPFPSWADLGYVTAYPCLIAGVLLLPGRRAGAAGRGRVVMDSFMTLVAMATFSWYFLLGPTLLDASQPALKKALAAFYPVADLLVLFCLLLTVGRARGSEPPRGMVALCLGLMVVVVTDVVFGYQTLHDVYEPGTIVDVGWPLGYLLLALGARTLVMPASQGEGPARSPVQGRETAQDPAETTGTGLPREQGQAVASGIGSLLPYSLVPMVAALLLGTAYEENGALLLGVYAGSALIVVLVVLRQVLAIRQNERLYVQLSDAFAQLEKSHRSLAVANAALAASEERFRAAAESASDVCYEYDHGTGRTEWFGDVARLGFAPESFPRTREVWQAALHPDDRDRVLAGFGRNLAEGGRFEMEYRVRRPDGQYRHWLARGQLMSPRQGTAPRIVGAVSDVTERKRAEALEAERAGLRQAVASMEGVLGVVGHELRTPLAGLRAMSEFLLTDGVVGSKDCEQMLSGINEEVVRMAETVNDLLEAARLNSGLAKWKWSRFTLRSVCEEAIDPIRPLVDEGQVRLECEVADGCEMRGDADAVRRLVLNLLSNARKYTKQGSIRVSARLTTEGGQRWAEITVADTGAGIPPEIRDRLGEAFALNAGMIGANHVNGTGLGLAICKGIAAAHGGCLSIRSNVGEGTMVVARLRADLPGAVTEQGKAAVGGLGRWETTTNESI